MFVLTIDQVRSRDGDDLVPELLASLDDVPVLAAFERTVGDEAQGVVADAAAVLTVVRRALVGGRWHVGLGIGEGEQPQTLRRPCVSSPRWPHAALRPRRESSLCSMTA